jgi:hypothetical protein
VLHDRVDGDVTVVELLAAYMKFAVVEYATSNEAQVIADAIKPLKKFQLPGTELPGGQVAVHENGFTRLKAAYLRRVIPDRHERTLRRLLVDRGVLDIDESYEPGVRAKGYRLTAPYRAGFRRIVCEDERIAARVRRLARSNDGAVRLDVHRHLRWWYRRLEIDRKRAEEIAITVTRSAPPARPGEPAPSPDSYQDAHLAVIDVIVNRDLDFSYCAQGRVHTVVTRLSRELRPTLRLLGRPLWNIDVVNSQPLILGLAMSGYRRAGDRFPITRSFNRKPANPYISFHSTDPARALGEPDPSNTMSTRATHESEPPAYARVTRHEFL